MDGHNAEPVSSNSREPASLETGPVPGQQVFQDRTARDDVALPVSHVGLPSAASLSAV